MWWFERRSSVQDLLSISERLRTTLRSLEEALGVSFSESEVGRLISEAEIDRVSEKLYCLYRSKKLEVSGVVDAYEPETVWIRVEGTNRYTKIFRRWLDDRRLVIGNRSPIFEPQVESKAHGEGPDDR